MAILNFFRPLLVILLSLGLGASPVAAASFEEHEVKAALLLKILRFVEWPEGAITTDDPVVACGLGRDALAAELEEKVPLEGVAGHRAEWRKLDPARLDTESQGCHWIYIAPEAGSQLHTLSAAGQRQPILLVGAWPGFLEGGGMLNLLIEQNKVRFEVHLERAHRHRLELSAKVLALASRVLTEFAPG